MVQYLPSVKAPKMLLLPAISLLPWYMDIKLNPKFLRKARRGIWNVSPFFAPNSLPSVNILPILNKYLSHEKEEMCWTHLANIGGVASHQIPMLTLLLICSCLERRSPPNHRKDVHHPNNQPPQKSQWGKVHLLLLARSLEVRKIRRGLTSALLSFAIWSTVCWKRREIFLLREKSVDRSWVDGWGGAPSLTIYRNVWNIHNRRILKFTLLQYKFKTTLKG